MITSCSNAFPSMATKPNRVRSILGFILHLTTPGHVRQVSPPWPAAYAAPPPCALAPNRDRPAGSPRLEVVVAGRATPEPPAQDPDRHRLQQPTLDVGEQLGKRLRDRVARPLKPRAMAAPQQPDRGPRRIRRHQQQLRQLLQRRAHPARDPSSVIAQPTKAAPRPTPPHRRPWAPPQTASTMKPSRRPRTRISSVTNPPNGTPASRSRPTSRRATMVLPTPGALRAAP